MRKYDAVVFDCFGTLFDMSAISRDQIGDYVRHVRSQSFEPYTFPQSWQTLRAFSDVAPGFSLLQCNGYKCIALSNGSKDLIEQTAVRSGFRFDHVVDLVWHQVYKPNLEAYRTVEIDTGIPPKRCVMVTANPTFGDLEGAAQIGMASQVIRHGFPDNVEQLAALLGC